VVPLIGRLILAMTATASSLAGCASCVSCDADLRVYFRTRGWPVYIVPRDAVATWDVEALAGGHRHRIQLVGTRWTTVMPWTAKFEGLIVLDETVDGDWEIHDGIYATTVVSPGLYFRVRNVSKAGAHLAFVVKAGRLPAITVRLARWNFEESAAECTAAEREVRPEMSKCEVLARAMARYSAVQPPPQ